MNFINHRPFFVTYVIAIHMYRKAGNTWYLVCCQARQILAWNDVVCSGDDMMTNVTFSVTAYQSAFLLVSSATITLAAAARAISPLKLPFHRVGKRRPLASLHAKGGARSCRRHPQFFRRRRGTQWARSAKNVKKPQTWSCDCHRDHSSITSSKRWVGGVRKWQFLMIYNHQRVGLVGQKKSKTWWCNTWIVGPL